jgi:hypothetical protein
MAREENRVDDPKDNGATVPSSETGVSSGLSTVAMTDEQYSGLRQLAEEVNEKLFAAGAAGAEQSFGLGCLVFALPLLIVDGILFVFGVFNLILALIVLIMGALVVAGLVTLLAYNARARRTADIYRKEVEPQIEQHLIAQELSRQDFDRVARETLSEGDPLSAYLAPIQENELPQGEDREE